MGRELYEVIFFRRVAVLERVGVAEWGIVVKVSLMVLLLVFALAAGF